MGRIPTPLYHLLMAHSFIDVMSRIGDKEGVGFPRLDIYHVCMPSLLISYGNMASRDIHINIVYCGFNSYWCSKSLVFDQ